MSNDTTTTNRTETRTIAATLAARSVEQTIAGLSEGMARAAAGLEQTQATLKGNSEIAMKKAAAFVTFGQANIEALTQSGQIWTAGVQDLSKQVAASLEASVQETLGVFKTLGSVKSLREAIELQSGFARTALEKAMADSNRLTQASLKLTEQALAPLADRVRLASDTFGKIAA